MRTPAILRNLTSANPDLVARSADLNELAFVHAIAGFVPLARFVDADDIEHPPAPAWYLPETRSIFIHANSAGYKGSTPITTRSDSKSVATVVGLLAHEAGHAAISDDMTPVQIAAPRHNDLLALFEELRVENHAVRSWPVGRKFLRASFSLILANLPDEFENKAHVVRAWAMVHGRTLAGISEPAETASVDTAARTLLGDEIVNGLTDLLQEALTLNLADDDGSERMVQICDEWRDLVGDPAEATSCTTCVRAAKPGETGEPVPGKAPGTEKTTEGDDEAEGSGGDGDGGDEAAEDDGTSGGAPSGDTGDEFTWGRSGAGDPAEDSDDHHHTDALTDEDAELMKALTRDLADLMQDGWNRDLDTVKIADAGRWAQTVFGNRKQSSRLETREPTTQMRQHVVTVAAALSNLTLPAIAKTAKATQVPPGRMRSREALRASAERAQGQMVSARPWKSTVRRHTTARPLVLGIATDTSGSMRWAEHGVAEFAYVYANAGHRIGARTAAVTFGDHVHRIARPGEVMNHVVTKTASDSTEEFDKAMAALDGVLHLTTPTASAKILLVISDGAFVKGHEPDKAAMWLRAMDKAGTHVVWITEYDTATSSYEYWLDTITKALPHLVKKAAFEEYRHKPGRPARARGDVFEMINRAALDAITKHVSA